MKTSAEVSIFLVSVALAFSTIAKADTLPAGAVRFNTVADPFDLPSIDVPEGQILVITDIATNFDACLLSDGDVRKIYAPGGRTINFQTGIEFTTQLHHTGGTGCGYATLSGYWLDAPK